MEADRERIPLPDLIRPAVDAPKLSAKVTPTVSRPAEFVTLKVVDSKAVSRPSRMKLLLPLAAVMELVREPPAVTVPPSTNAPVVELRPPLRLTVPPFNVRLRKELNWPSEVMVAPELRVTAGLLEIAALPQVSDPAMPKVPPLLTTMLLPALLPRVRNFPPSTVTPPVKLLEVFCNVSVPADSATPPAPLIVRVKLPP